MADIPMLVHHKPLVRALASIPPAAWRAGTAVPSVAPHQEEPDMLETEEDPLEQEHDASPESLDLAERDTLASEVFGDNRRLEQAAAVKMIGARMREARELCNLSQREAARRLGYSNPSKLSKVEGATDTNSVPLWLIVRAAKVYEISADWLFGLTDDWETGVQRGVQPWLLEAWEKARRRDMAVFENLHAEIAAVSKHVPELAAGVLEVAHALETWRARNPAFDETRASGAVVGRLDALMERAKTAEGALKRFHSTLRPGAAPTIERSTI